MAFLIDLFEKVKLEKISEDNKKARTIIQHGKRYSQGTKVGKMLTLAPERYTAEFGTVAKIILWFI